MEVHADATIAFGRILSQAISIRADGLNLKKREQTNLMTNKRKRHQLRKEGTCPGVSCNVFPICSSTKSICEEESARKYLNGGLIRAPNL